MLRRMLPKTFARFKLTSNLSKLKQDRKMAWKNLKESAQSGKCKHGVY